MTVNERRTPTNQEISDSLQSNTAWQGSPDKMWQNISTELKKTEAPMPRHPWWKMPRTWAATAAAAVFFLVIVLINWPLHPSPSMEKMSLDALEESPQILADETGPVLYSEPMPMMATEPEHYSATITVPESVTPGDEISVTLKLEAHSERLAVSNNLPQLHIWSIDPGSLNQLVDTQKVPELTGLILEVGSVAEITVHVTAPKTPGYYNLQLEGDLDLQGDSVAIYSETNFVVQ